MKLPPNLIPPLHSGGKDSWWSLADIVVNDSQIKATYKLNILNKGRITIDRHTGDIDVSGLQMRFSGSCERATETPEERKF